MIYSLHLQNIYGGYALLILFSIVAITPLFFLILANIFILVDNVLLLLKFDTNQTMTSFPTLVQPFLDIANSVTHTIYCFVPLCVGVLAAWNKEIFLRAVISVGLFVFVFSKISNFAPDISNLFNSAFIFLISGFLISTGIKFLFDKWRGY